MKILRDWLKAERGRATQLAKALDLFPNAISQWKNIPAKHVLEIERITGISRHDLRPDLYGPAPAVRPQQDAAA
jgi:DNA-binding transcriptional regulator YdaS (Cro superfamily)